MGLPLRACLNPGTAVQSWDTRLSPPGYRTEGAQGAQGAQGLANSALMGARQLPYISLSLSLFICQMGGICLARIRVGF